MLDRLLKLLRLRRPSAPTPRAEAFFAGINGADFWPVAEVRAIVDRVRAKGKPNA